MAGDGIGCGAGAFCVSPPKRRFVGDHVASERSTWGSQLLRVEGG